MPVTIYKPTRAARKNMSIVDRSALHQGKPLKRLSRGAKRLSGRGAEGKITVRHRGGGMKRKLRNVDMGQEKLGIPATVERVEYDPQRSAFLALLCYQDGERRYRLAWEGVKPGDITTCGPEAVEQPGNRLPLAKIIPGTMVFNVELKPGRGGALARAAGCAVLVMDVTDTHAQLKMSSGEVRLIPNQCYATVGQASNADKWLERVGSAGRQRRRGRRPQVRGKAQNPVDHPHGGGEGSQPIGMKHPKTKWGKPAFGVKTRRRNKYSNALILRRRSKKKK